MLMIMLNLLMVLLVLPVIERLAVISKREIGCVRTFASMAPVRYPTGFA